MPIYRYDEEKNLFYEDSLNEKFQLPQIVWHITDKCRLNCFYCFSNKTNEEMNIQDLDMYISKLKYLDVQKIDISGGEPLLFKNLDLLCAKLVNEGFKLTITTTGTGAEENIEWLIKNSDLFSRIIISVDILNDNLQDKICKGKEVLNNAKKLHKRLIKKGYKKIRINTVVTNFFLNICEIRKMAEYMVSTGVIEWCIIEPYMKENNIFEENFEYILNNIKLYMKSQNVCKIIYRRSKNYDGYWILLPNGDLLQRSRNLKENIQFSFIESQIEKIKENIITGYINFPGKE